MTIDKLIKLEKVIGTEIQVDILYDLLSKRYHNISNMVLPSHDEHQKFIKRHPYRVWYLLKLKSTYIGTAYVMMNNCVGISIISNFEIFPNILNAILKKHRPLREIKSVRPPYFYINIAPSNAEIEAQLIKLNSQKIQITFRLS